MPAISARTRWPFGPNIEVVTSDRRGSLSATGTFNAYIAASIMS